MKQCDFSFFLPFFFIYCISILYGLLVLLFVFPLINVRESDLRDVMEEFGTVDSVKLIIDRDTRRSKGFAFVEMPEDSEAQNAIRDLNGATYEGRQMVVKEALPRN